MLTIILYVWFFLLNFILSLFILYLVYLGLYLFESCIYIKRVIFIRNKYKLYL